MHLKRTVSDRAETVDALFAELQATRDRDFRAQGSSPAEPAVARSIAMRYEGQNYEQEIPVPDGPFDRRAARRRLRALPRSCTTSSTATASTALPVELVRLLVTATAADTAPLPPLSLDVPRRRAAGAGPRRARADVSTSATASRPRRSSRGPR